MRVECIKCRKRDTIVKKISEQEKRRILCPEYRVEKKKSSRTGEKWCTPQREKHSKVVHGQKL